MPEIENIRELYDIGTSISEIARVTGTDRKTVRKYIMQEDFSSPTPVPKKRGSKLDAYEDIIRGYLEEDKKTWRKQRHTARRIYERLRDEHGYEGSYPLVARRVKEIRQLQKNPYTEKVTRNRVYFTADFKAAYYERYQKGERVRDILKALGYDPALFTQQQMSTLTHRIKEQGEKGAFTDKAQWKPEVLPADKDIDPRLLEPTQENIARLWTELKYLKAQQEAFSSLVPGRQETRTQDS